MKVYADNAATTKISPAALAAMNACMQECWGNPSSLRWAGQKAAEALSDARERVARCLNAIPREITFTSGGSEADIVDVWTLILYRSPGGFFNM